MKKYLFAIVTLLLVGIATLSVISRGGAQQSKNSAKSEKREVREQRRQERLDNYAKFMDSLVMSRNFSFNPQTMQQEPAGSMRIIANPHYELGVWDGTVDVCLPYIKGYVPPYYVTVINYTVPMVENYTTEQTPDGWTVRFQTSLYSASTYTFTLDISNKMGGATLTITNPWYNPVQYSGTISQLY